VGEVSCYCDYDPSDVWDERKRKARKEHVCYECREKIEKGDEYVYITSLSDGSWWHYKICEYCEHDWKIVREAGHCYLIGGLQIAWEDMWDG